MGDNKYNLLTEDDLISVIGGTSIAVSSEPKYNIGQRLRKRSNPNNCFGSVINRKYENGQWIYTIMGSGTKPETAEENELEVITS